MQINFYIIRGRGEGGLKFQLARVEDETGNSYKGQYDMQRHFASQDEMQTYIADEVVKKPVTELTFNELNL